MAEGIEWLLEPYVVDCVTFARGIEPADLVARLGGRPGQKPRGASADDAVDALAAPDVDSVARVGRVHDWSFAVEYGDAVGSTAAGLEAVSRDGVEAINFLLTPWHPPSTFTYYRDAALTCSFGIGQETWRRGRNPDLLVPALEEAGVLPVGRQLTDAARRRGRQLSVLAIGAHFGLRLPRHDIVEGRLPLYRVRER
ncbi:DUF6461 domain-containing protein [Streptomyces sp. NPDC051569]|uniref:DUF6461 domain-containing protein n=1 Tax=Streptomyces sp. NPDC051569 TaxID=3365661 RepID=UPI0037A6E53B